VVDEVPIFPGLVKMKRIKELCFSRKKCYQHIVDNFTYPKEAQEKRKFKGKYNVNFVIGTDGVIQKLRMRGRKMSFLRKRGVKNHIALYQKK